MDDTRTLITATAIGLFANVAEAAPALPNPAGGAPIAPGTCEAVQGAIPQNGWCVLFVRRKA